MIDQATSQQVVSTAKTTTDFTLQILSWTLNLIGLAIGVAGLMYAIAQGKKTKTAEAQVKKVKMDLYHQKASQVFVQMNSASSALTASIRSNDWVKAMDGLISLGGQIANALGAFPELIGETGTKDLTLCAENLARMFDSLPISANEPCRPEVVKSLIVTSVTVDFKLQTIAGKMRLAIELENPNERNDDSVTHRGGPEAPIARREANEVDTGEDGAAETDLGADADRI
jgi:hypothetical protein